MGKFFAFLYRMKYISRWSLMRSVRNENVAEHSFHVAVLAHALAVISRDVFGNKIDPCRAAACALYHDMPEILTGDLPTPIKYYDPEIKNAYKRIEHEASEKLLGYLSDDIREGISSAVLDSDGDITRLIRAADKLDAYIKCTEEQRAGNAEFARAALQTRAALDAMELPEVEYFIKNYMPAFSLTLDELEG